MGKPVSLPKISDGTQFEYRLARLRFAQGYFVRCSIDVWPSRFVGDKLAEIDCLAVSFDPQLKRSLELMECKTARRGQGEIDRLVWLKGMGAYARADTVSLARPRVAQRAREFAQQLGIGVLDEAAIASAEEGLGLDPSIWPGFHNPVFGERIVKPARSVLNSSPEIRRAGKFLFGSFWFTDVFSRIKQLHTFFRLLVHSSLDFQPLRLAIGEATTLFTMTVLSVASWRNQLAEDEFRQLVVAKLSTGLGDHESLRTLLQQIDQLQREQLSSLHTAYEAAGAGRLVFPVKSLEAEILTPFEWIDAFINLVGRFLKRAHLATDVLRWVDLWAAELVGSPQKGYLRDSRERQYQAALDLVVGFLSRQWGVPIELFEPIVSVSNEEAQNRSLTPQEREPLRLDDAQDTEPQNLPLQESFEPQPAPTASSEDSKVK